MAVHIPKLENGATLALFLFVAALQVSIAASAILLTVTLVLLVSLLILKKERPEIPPIFWPLLLYALATMVSVVASLDPIKSLQDSKEVLLFLVVPVVYLSLIHI